MYCRQGRWKSDNVLLIDNNFDMHKSGALNELPQKISAGERCITHNNTLTDRHLHTYTRQSALWTLFAFALAVVVLRHKLPGKEDEKIEE